jgi:serine/threonine-protein kinase
MRPVGLPDALIGTRLSSRYKVLEKIGEGGMGMIYLAEDERLGKKVVVKMLPPAFAGRAELAGRFAQEAKLTSRIEHENIVDITDLVVSAPPFYVMEHLKGTDLSAVIYGDGRLQWDERTQDMLAQVCRALGAAHKLGIIHRDMKPENIFIVEHSDGRRFVKILDFGIAKLLSEGGIEARRSERPGQFTDARTGRLHLTNAGTVLGTPHYMAPEQGQGATIDHRSDIYAVGVIMYELLTGQLPFDIPGRAGMDLDIAAKIVAMHIKETPIPPRTRRPEANIPEEVEAVILKAMRKAPDERFADIREMEAAILKCAAPKHKPRIKIAADATGARADCRSLEGLARIRKEDESRRTTARVRTNIIVAGAIAAFAASGAMIAGSRAFHRTEPAVESISAPRNGHDPSNGADNPGPAAGSVPTAQENREADGGKD